jgi:anti-anti-sigma regulatory factor
MPSPRKPRKKSIKLNARLDTAQAPQLYEILSRQSEVDFKLDLSEVRWIGAACAEILVNAVASRRLTERKIELINPSEDFLAGVQLLGLQNWFNSLRAGQS